MQEFTILDNGRLSDAIVLKTMELLRDDVPRLDPTAVEAHMTLFRAYGVFFAAVSARYEELGLSHSRFNMLRWLYHADDGRLSMTDLGARLEASVPNVIRMVQALEVDGWVRRIEGTEDRRVRFVQLTEDGCERFRLLLPRAVQIWEEVWSGLSTEEMQMLSHLLAKLRVSLLSRYLGGDDLMSYRMEARRRRRKQT
jgi:DNA-binding MarR family transcriptional regulator